MSDVVLYIAATLDGFIASSDGGIDWLKPFEQAGEDYGYAAFHARVGAVIIGGNTYRQALGFGEWPYAGVTTWVATRRGLAGERQSRRRCARVCRRHERPRGAGPARDGQRHLAGRGRATGDGLRQSGVDRRVHHRHCAAGVGRGNSVVRRHQPANPVAACGNARLRQRHRADDVSARVYCLM